MIFVIGAFFWVLAMATMGRLLYASRAVVRTYAWQWGLLTLMAISLLFRPHVDIFGGEDPGSYLNSGVAYGRQGTLFYVDPLLDQVPPETRSAFYYGHAGYGTTKDACLWVVNTNVAMLGPHFQPAYPLLISVATRLGKNSWSLYVVPLFALFTGLALMVLASRLLAHRLAGLIAFGCYLLNPLTLWHARCARPEIIAGFMVFAGLAMLLLAWQERPWTHWLDILLGALCIGAAPFFHITAWYLGFPAAMAVGLLILRGRLDFLLYPLVALGMLMMFHVETRYVTDYYHVNRVLDATLDAWPFLAMSLVFLAGISLAVNRTQLRGSTELAARPRGSRRTKVQPGSADQTPPICLGESPRRERAEIAAGGNTPPAVSGWLAAGLALVCALFLVNVFFNRESIGRLPILGSMVPNYNFLTDGQTFINMVSMPIALLMLIGWAAWLIGDRLWRAERIGLALTVFPALVLAGTMRDFMMTRYLLLAIIPVSALCLTALVTRLPEWKGRPWTAWLAPGLAAIICLMGLTHRGHLVTLVEHRGFLHFLAPFARTIQQDHGIMLGEYSRITAPIEHMFGVPALGLDNERKDNYFAAEFAWEMIMRAHPDQPAFFLTPFQTPRSERFDFTLVKQAVFQDRKLQQAFNHIPTRIQEMPLCLSLYRMTLKNATTPAAAITNATALVLESGNMGMCQFANVRVEKPVLEGVALAEGERISLRLPSNPASNSLALILVIYASDPCPAAPLVSGAALPPEGHNAFQFQPLADQWWAYICRPIMSGATNPLEITARSPLFIADAFCQTKTNVVQILAGSSKSTSKKVLPPLRGRWARADAAILAPASLPGYMLMLVFVPTVAPVSPTLLTAQYCDTTRRQILSDYLHPGAWQWRILWLGPDCNRDTWIRFQIQPAWNPRKAGFPSDLGLFFGKVIVAPAPCEEMQNVECRMQK